MTISRKRTRLTSRNVRTEHTQAIRTISAWELRYCLTLAHLSMDEISSWTAASEKRIRYIYEYLVNDKHYDLSYGMVSALYWDIRSLGIRQVNARHGSLDKHQYSQGYRLIRELHTGGYGQESEFNRHAIVAKLFRTYHPWVVKSIVSSWLSAGVYADNRTMTQRLNDMRKSDEIPF